MRHPNLQSKYYKAQRLFNRKKYRRAKWLFFDIVLEITSSDTESMADINIGGSAQNYLDEIDFILKKKKNKSSWLKFLRILFFVLLVSMLIFLIIFFN